MTRVQYARQLTIDILVGSILLVFLVGAIALSIPTRQNEKSDGHVLSVADQNNVQAVTLVPLEQTAPVTRVMAVTIPETNNTANISKGNKDDTIAALQVNDYVAVMAIAMAVYGIAGLLNSLFRMSYRFGSRINHL